MHKDKIIKRACRPHMATIDNDKKPSPKSNGNILDYTV